MILLFVIRRKTEDYAFILIYKNNNSALGLQQTPVVLKSPMEETGVAVKPKPFITVPPLPSEPAVNTFSRCVDRFHGYADTYNGI